MKTWRWVSPALIYAIHDAQLARHGGLSGVRDENAVDAALNRARQLAAYRQPEPDAAELAAAYMFGLARNHGFSDGNKRIAWIAARVFLLDNGENFRFSEAEAIETVIQLASGKMDEVELATWIRKRLQENG
jgi:death-on-curing protein